MSEKKFFYGFVIFLAAFLSYWGWSLRSSRIQSSYRGSAGILLPPFKMKSSGAFGAISREDLFGKVWIADFIFTRCNGPCPILTANMAQLQRDLPKEAMLVTFTVDPDWDKPEILNQYAESFGADPKRWLFLTGEKKALYDLVYEGFKLSLLEEPKHPAGFRVTHSTKLALVDKKGMIRNYYDGTDSDALKNLKEDAIKLLKSGDL